MRKLVISLYADDPVPLKRIHSENYPTEFIEKLGVALSYRLESGVEDVDIPL
jgi:hypothetical protein